MIGRRVSLLMNRRIAEVAFALDVEHVGASLRRLGDGRVGEGERIRARGREQSEREPRVVLLDRRQTRASRIHRGTATAHRCGTGHHRARRHRARRSLRLAAESRPILQAAASSLAAEAAPYPAASRLAVRQPEQARKPPLECPARQQALAAACRAPSESRRCRHRSGDHRRRAASSCRHRRRRRNLNQCLAVESRRRRIGVFCRRFIDAYIFVRQLDEDLELDRHQVVAANALRASGRRQGLERGKLLAAERLARRGQYLLCPLHGLGARSGGGRDRFRRRSLRTCRGLPLCDDRRAEHYEPGSTGANRGQTT